MTTVVSTERGRRWADIVAILASVVLFGYSVWGGILAGDSEAMAEVGNLGLARASSIVAGLLGVIGIFVAQRARGAGRVIVMLAGVVALIGLFAFTVVDATAMLAAGVPGLLLLVAGMFVGPMPGPGAERA
ncbi:MAG TPA: hypothetical protein VFU01_09795 [Gemmatimonadaceae bacterium]|nr:hypothetical protein [Gemmatimonadaceae bacterium]